MIRFLLIFAGLAASVSPALAVCAPDAADLRGPWGQARFSVEVADEPEERSRGLMFRQALGRSAGMLFVYQQPQRAVFWMKNTLIPLDMLFIDETGTVRRIARMTTPLSTQSVPGGDGILMVLEINGGAADMFGLAEGAVMRHPAIDQAGAAWTCGD